MTTTTHDRCGRRCDIDDSTAPQTTIVIVLPTSMIDIPQGISTAAKTGHGVCVYARTDQARTR
jgi:hypothetical protein